MRLQRVVMLATAATGSSPKTRRRLRRTILEVMRERTGTTAFCTSFVYAGDFVQTTKWYPAYAFADEQENSNGLRPGVLSTQQAAREVHQNLHFNVHALSQNV